jgi:hypothetical protein
MTTGLTRRGVLAADTARSPSVKAVSLAGHFEGTRA